MYYEIRDIYIFFLPVLLFHKFVISVIAYFVAGDFAVALEH
jgi:hypothetical protein